MNFNNQIDQANMEMISTNSPEMMLMSDFGTQKK